MSTIDSLQVLIEIEYSESKTEDVATTTFAVTPIIKRIVRTFESRARAEEDLELLMEVNPTSVYRIDPVQHIER